MYTMNPKPYMHYQELVMKMVTWLVQAPLAIRQTFGQPSYGWMAIVYVNGQLPSCTLLFYILRGEAAMTFSSARVVKIAHIESEPEMLQVKE